MAGWLTWPLLPLWAGASAVRRRWRTDWRERWGLSVPSVQPGATWIVASSVGEVRAGAALAAALEGPVLLTADTDSGAEVARQLWPVSGRKPVDHLWTLAPLWAEARPRTVVWVEGAWWPALAALAREAGVPTARVGARPGPGTARRLRLGLECDQVWARDGSAAAWFRARGVQPRGVVALKEAAPLPPNPLTWSRSFGVAGSVRQGDLEAVEALRAADRDLAWLVAPRHLDELPRWEMALGEGTVRRSALTDGIVPANLRVVLLDTVGELSGCYTGAEVAFVGGTSEEAVGGHSPVEAWRSGVPTLAGPFGQSQGAVWERAGTLRVETPQELPDALERARGSAPPPAPTPDLAALASSIAELGSGPAPEAPPRPWARPASWVHRSARRGWHAAWNQGLRSVARVEVPVVSVGSANARSPGRTAAVRWLCRALAARGWRPGVACRGYRRLRGGLAVSWEDPSWQVLGDEGALLALEGWPVAASVRRIRAVRALVGQGVDVVVLDDGLQHRQVHRDLDLVVVDGRYPTSRGELPLGEGREAPVPARVHGVVLQHGDTLPDDIDVPVVRGHRRPGPWHQGDSVREAGPDGPVAAFAGIGRPADFRSGLEVPVARFRGLADHQPVDGALARELERWADGLPLVCTDKDRVRLPDFLAERVWWRTIELEAHAPEAWFDRLQQAREGFA